MSISLIIMTFTLLAPLSSGQPKPGKLPFIVAYEEQGKNVNESWSYSGVVKFPLSNWSEPLCGRGYTPEERKLLLEFDPGAFLKRQAGAVVKFYPSEVEETGSAGMKNPGTCVKNFSEGPLADYIKALEEWRNVTDSLATAVSSEPSEFQTTAKETIPRIESLLQRTQWFDKAGQSYIAEFNGCSESVNSVMEVLLTAETVTIDSIKTKS